MRDLDLSQTLQKLRLLSRILWVRVALILALSILAALSAELLDPLIPTGSKDRFTEEATLPILNVLANGMLAVATFSLGVMVSSHRTMAQQTTPRIHRLLMEDTSTQSILATFIGAFAYALCSIILFRAGYYSDSASVIVFATTVLVVATIIVSLVRWIHQLSRIGSMDYALLRAEDTAREALEDANARPALGARIFDDSVTMPDDATAITATSSGYLRRIDMQSVQELAKKEDAVVFIDVLPGDRILSEQQMGNFSGKISPDALAACFVLSPNRSYEQDSRYAIQALRETASKALSPGINDPGTAVEVIARLERLLWDGLQTKRSDDDPLFDRVYVKQLADNILIDLAFREIARDGNSFVEVLLAISDAIATMEQRCDEKVRGKLDDLRRALDQHAEVGLSTKAEREAYRRGSVSEI
ncbi:DUF2254 domain-containing protein [Rhodobacteraceae bacterium]|nr:DUF2254 domain-containing protein [Paracoccaceae bacterium]